MTASPLLELRQPDRGLTAFVEERALSAPTDEVFRLLSPERPAESISNETLNNEMRRWERALRSSGVSAGDVVLLAFDHSGDLIFAFFGALRAGAIPTILPSPPPTKTSGYRDMILERASSASAGALATNTSHGDDLGESLVVISAPSDDTEAVSPSSGLSTDVAYLQFTGGTTGSPKAIALSHRTIVEYVRRTARALSIESADRTVGWLPLHHDMGLVTQVLTPLLTGSSATILCPAHWIGQPEILFRAISDDGGTITWMPNFAFRHCLRRIRPERLVGIDLSTWRIVGSGSEPVQAEALEEFWATYGPYGLEPEASVVGYGAAEHVAGISLTPLGTPPRVDWVSKPVLTGERRAEPVQPGGEGPGAESRIPIVSCGYPKEGVAIGIIDDDGKPLEERQVGEITIESDLLFGGYIGQPESTRKAIRDGRFHTGDLGYLADGQLYVCGRKSDVLIIGGATIHPHHIEEIILEQMGERARLAVAFGIPVVDLGTEVPVTVCELREPSDPETLAQVARGIRRAVSDRLGIGLADIRFVDKGWVVTGTSGKLGRGRCRQKYLDSDFSPDEVPETVPPGPAADDLENRLLRIWRSILRVNHLGVHEDFFGIGGTSILAAELFAEIEYELDRKLPLATLLAASTVAEQSRLLRQLTPPSWEALVAIQPEGELPPLFCCAGIGGNILTYMDLSRRLGPARPCYALQSRGLGGDQEAPTDLHQIARAHIREIKQVQAEGPYHLCGSSFGGLVAYEIARQLHRLGDEVALVAMFDTYGPGVTPTLQGTTLRRRLSRLRLRVETHATNLFQGDWRARRRYTIIKAGRLLRKWRKRVRRGLARSRDDLPARLEKVEYANLQALLSYQPGPYPGKVILFRATRQPAGVPADNGWSEVTKLEIRDVRGHHGALVYEPQVAALAAALAAEVEAGAGS